MRAGCSTRLMYSAAPVNSVHARTATRACRSGIHVLHDHHGEPVVALAADELDGGCLNASLGRERGIEFPDALHFGISRMIVDDLAVAHDVVHDDEPPRTGQPNRPVEVLHVSWLVRVDEDEIERSRAFGFNGRQSVLSGAETQVDAIVQTGPVEVPPGHVSVTRIDFK